MVNVLDDQIQTYPRAAQQKLQALRALIYQVALVEKLGEIEESLKWGEASFTTQTGSPVRLDWKRKSPQYIGVFFNCNTQLVASFKELYPSELQYQGKRAIILAIAAPLPEVPLRHCLALALNYKKLKHLPLLGC